MSDNFLDVEIVSPVKIVWEGQAKFVTAPGILGEFQILYNHAPFISIISTGKINIMTSDNQELNYTISGGLLEVKNNSVSILVESIVVSEKDDVKNLSNL